MPGCRPGLFREQEAGGLNAGRLWDNRGRVGSPCARVTSSNDGFGVGLVGSS